MTAGLGAAEADFDTVDLLGSQVGHLLPALQPVQFRGLRGTEALRQLLQDPPSWDRIAIARQAAARFSRRAVGLELLRQAEQAVGRP